MANESMVPLLPCASIDEISDFATALGFEVTYRQTRPNPYLAPGGRGSTCTTSGLRASVRKTRTARASSWSTTPSRCTTRGPRACARPTGGSL
ncbi:hypothetical protein NKG05_26365 [Oerskovia sp. M15]